MTSYTNYVCIGLEDTRCLDRAGTMSLYLPFLQYRAGRLSYILTKTCIHKSCTDPHCNDPICMKRD